VARSPLGTDFSDAQEKADGRKAYVYYESSGVTGTIARRIARGLLRKKPSTRSRVRVPRLEVTGQGLAPPAPFGAGELETLLTASGAGFAGVAILGAGSIVIENAVDGEGSVTPPGDPRLALTMDVSGSGEA
jgi:hypothetical protein